MASDQALTVVSSSDTEFRFVCRFDSDLSDLETRIGVDSSVSYIRTIQVAVPAGAEASLEDYDTRRQAPLPQSAVSYNQKLVLSGDVVRVSRPIMVRGYRLVSVQISPVTAMGVFSEVEVGLRFSRATKTPELSSSADPAFDRVMAHVVANYETARRWPTTARQVRSGALDTRANDDFAAAAQWYKVVVTGTGLYQITGAQLQSAGISLSGLRSDSLRLYNGGGMPNELDNPRPRPTFEEIAVLVIDGGDGQFGSSDRIVFYGEGMDRWILRDGFVSSFMNNPYTTQNVYWLAVSGHFSGAPARMAQEDGSLSGVVDTVVNTCLQEVHVEQDKMISTDFDGHVTDYFTWFWSDSNHLSVYASTPGAIVADTANLFLNARTSGSSGTSGYIDIQVNNVPGLSKLCNTQGCTFETVSLNGASGSLNRFDLSLTGVNPSKGIPPYFNYLEVRYPSRLQVSNNKGRFVIQRDGRWAEIQIVDNFTVAPTLFDISNPRRPVVITGYAREDGWVKCRRFVSADSSLALYCDIVAQAGSPVSIASADIVDLRQIPGQKDLIMVTTRALASSLDEYVAYRTAQGHNIQVVAVEDVMDNFSYGLFDPAAIRDFLKYAYETYPSPAPSAVLLVGDANYDYVDNLGTGVPNWVPSYETQAGTPNSDDNYVYFGAYGLLDSDTSYAGGGRGYDMMTARWSVRSAAEINAIVGKLKDYESSNTLGSWRSRVTLVADDEHGQYDNEIYHTTQTETLQQYYIPADFIRNKIYMWEYPFVNQEKPAVTEDILKAFNEGSLIVNYVGHGNPDVWAHEHVLERGSDLPRIRNYDRLPLVFAASCAIGFFDDPRREGMAEDFLASTQGGAIGVISATRLVYSGPNSLLNQAVYGNLFSPDDLSICEALYAAKLSRQYPDPIPRPISNDRAYVFMGDPYVKLDCPELKIDFAEYPDSLVALSRTQVAGRLLDRNDQPVNLDGTLSVTVYDAYREKVFAIDYDTAKYDVDGPGIFRGAVTVSGGEFSFEFIPPLDVSYGRPGARITAYFTGAATDGLGAVHDIPVSQSLVSTTDSIGPVVDYGIVGRSSFVSGDAVTSADRLRVSLSDSSGINLADGIGHGIVLTIDGNTDAPVNLSESFAYDQDDYMAGELTYALSDLAEGEHRMKITAWDNANNVSVVTFSVEVAAAGVLAINDLLNFPNPMGERTTFYFELTVPTEQLNLEIFTLSGRKIWRYSGYGLGADRYPNDNLSITWDGRDNDGDRVATGVYIYKLSAAPMGGETVEQFGKLVVLN